MYHIFTSCYNAGLEHLELSFVCFMQNNLYVKNFIWESIFPKKYLIFHCLIVIVKTKSVNKIHVKDINSVTKSFKVQKMAFYLKNWKSFTFKMI